MLWGLTNKKIKRSITFHAQTNVQNKLVNHTITHMVHINHQHANKWDGNIPIIQYGYFNHTMHNMTNTSPFEACHDPS